VSKSRFLSPSGQLILPEGFQVNLATRQTGPLLSAALLKRGDQLLVEAWADDGKTEGASLRSNRVVVVNTPPTLSPVSFVSDLQPGGSRIRAVAEAADVDGDTVYLSYRWVKNGTLWKEGGDETIDSKELFPSDVVTVEVTPRDQHTTGKMVRSQPLTVANRPPSITSAPSTAGGQHVFEYQVKAVDPDGDPLRYNLEQAPPGMAIDKDSGAIVWSRSTAQEGLHRVRVVVDDGRGGSTFQEFDLAITAPQPSSPPGA